MYKTSDKFKAYTDTSIVRRPKSKINVGGVTYTGETALVTYPKISHSAERMIGVFPAKTCEFELLNRAGDIFLNGKEVTVYRGLEIDGETEWVPMGIFSASDDNITNELTKRTIRFKGTDRSALFDTQFVNDITYPCTVLAFVQHICERHGVTLETTAFPFANRILLSAPNADSSISERELIARVAELGGCIAQISRSGGLRISAPQSTGKKVKHSYYKTLSKEPEYGSITAVTLGHSNYNDDIVYPESANETAVNWRIEDNPFVDGAIAASDGATPTIRETLIADVAANIIGKSLIPFSVRDFVDDFIFDLNDSVTIEEKNGSTFETVVLNVATGSRIKSTLGASVQTTGSTNYILAGSVKQGLKRVSLEVDHQNNRITALVRDFSDFENQTESSLSVMSGEMKGVVTNVGKMQSSITQLSDSVDIRFNNLATPNSLINAVTRITPEGVKIYNGKIEIFNSDNEKIFGTDSRGALDVTGNIRVKFKNATGTDTATLKITNEDYANDEYATASIKIFDSTESEFAEIEAFVDGNGIANMNLTADAVSITTDGGQTGVSVSTDGVTITGDTTLQGDLRLTRGLGINVIYDLLGNEVPFLNLPDGYKRFSIGGGDWETYFWTDRTVFHGAAVFNGSVSSASTIVTNYDKTDIFAGLKHYRKINGDLYSNAFAIGKDGNDATAAIELRTENGEDYIKARLDIREGQHDTDAIELRGMNSYNGGTYSSWLELGASELTWGGATIAVSSSAEKKSNISAAGLMLDKIRNAGIYSYNYISEAKSMGEAISSDELTLNSVEPEKKAAPIHYGLVIGEDYSTPQEVVGSDGKHIDLYSMIALAWKAIQELADRIDTEVIDNVG